MELDRTCQRIVGTLIEKELSVPDIYPMSLNALVDGCNQKSNRDPVMELESFQIEGALRALQEREVVQRMEGGGRVAKYRHRLREKLSLDNQGLAVLAELLVRGPQAAGALKPRVARMGWHAEPDAIAALLDGLARRSPPVVELMPLGPRERDRRWRHLLGPMEAGSGSPEAHAAPTAAETPRAAPATRAEAPVEHHLEERVAALELSVAQLRAELADMKRPV